MRWWHRLNLRSKIILGISLTMSAILGGSFIGVSQYIRAQLWAREIQEAQNLNGMATNLIEEAMMVGRKDVIQKTIEQFGNSVGGDINSIAVYDDQSILTSFATGFLGGISVPRENLTLNINDPTCIDCHQLPAEERPGMMIISDGGQDVLRSVFPLYNEPRCQTCHGTGQIVLGDSIVDLTMERYQQSSLTVTLALGSGITLALILVAIVVYQLLNRTVLSPLNEVVDVSQAVVLGELDKEVHVRSGDEIGVLAKAFNTMTGQLRTMIGNLEQRVTDRTQDLERRSQQIKTAADIGSAVASIRDLDLLLPQVTEMISERFGYYHVGIFLLDSRNEFAILRAANSEGGQRMLNRKHRLKVGEVGIVGYVTGKNEPRIALDVGDDAVFFNNPDLPDTRSEMALPLVSGGELIGALDLQSTQESAFTTEDIEILQILADQIAGTIANTKLISETQEAYQTIQRIYGEQSQTAWKNYLRTQEFGYQISTEDVITPIGGEWTADMKEAAQKGEIVQTGSHTIAVPMIIRDQVLGVIKLRKQDHSGKWDKDEITLVDTLIDQIENALESARLFSDTQHRSERDQLTQQLSDRIHRAADIDLLMQTVIQDVATALGATGAFVQFGTLQEGLEAGNGNAPSQDKNANTETDREMDHQEIRS